MANCEGFGILEESYQDVPSCVPKDYYKEVLPSSISLIHQSKYFALLLANLVLSLIRIPNKIGIEMLRPK